MNIDEAVQAVSILKPKHVVPMLELGKDLADFKKKKFNKQIQDTEVVLLRPGTATG
ncbi:MAG: hypothetical protein ACOC44_10740 [Promethearchaeia archaeon]